MKKKTTGNEKIDEQWRSTRAQNSTAEVSFFTIIIRLSLHDGDHDGVIKIVVGLSCEL